MSSGRAPHESPAADGDPGTADPHGRGPQRFLPQALALSWGLQFAFLTPTIGLLLVALYGATAREVGWSLAAYNISGFVSNLVIPTRADRTGDYTRPMVWCGALTLALTCALAAAPTLPWAVLALVLLGGPAGVAMGLLFAHLRSAGVPTAEVMRTRAVFSFAFAVGPPLATFIVGLLGDRSVLVFIAGIALVGMGLSLVLTRLTRVGLEGRPSVEPEPLWSAVRRPGVWPLLSAFVLLQAANSASVVVMTLFVTDRLGLDVLWGGIALGVAAALEIPALLLIGRLATRFGSLRLLVVGGGAGVAYFLLVASATGPVVLVASQALNAAFVAAIAGAGLTVFQDVLPRPGLASALFTNTFRVGAIVAGPLIGLGQALPIGYAAVFLGCAVLAVAGIAVILVSRRRGALVATT